MNEQKNYGQDSILLEKVLSDFLNNLSKDDAIPSHILAAFKEHFKTKTTISVQEVRTLLATSAELSC